MTNRKIIEVERLVVDYFSEKDIINILDAGCGSINNLRISKNKSITGIDISEKQLERSIHLDKKILGDIEKYQYEEFYDLIICWDVLEHLKNPQAALSRFFSAFNDGIVILKLPNVYSLKGLITKFTPFSLHYFIYKHILWKRRVHKEEYGPFKTYLKFCISRNGIIKYANKNDCEVIFSSTYDFADIWNPLDKRFLGKVYYSFKKIIEWLSFGTIGDSEIILVLKKTSPNT